MSNIARNPGNNHQDSRLLIDDGESDNGSSYAESPADGYFRERSHPHDVFVQNPSMQVESKANESRMFNMNNPAAGQNSQMSSPAASLRSRSYSAESLPILDAGPAPPDYAAATAQRVEHQPMSYHDNAWVRERSSEERRTSYGSMDDSQHHMATTSHQSDYGGPFGNTNNPFGSGFPFASNNNPFGPGFPFHPPHGAHAGGDRSTPVAGQRREMSDHIQPRNDSLEETVLLRWNRQPQAGRKSWFSRSPCKPKSYVKILVAVAIALLIVWVASSYRAADKAHGGNSDGSKSKTPANPGRPDGGDNLHKLPQVPKPPFPTATPSPSCPLNFHTDTMAFDFKNLDSFLFVEALEKTPDFEGNVRGNVHVRPAQAKQDSDIILSISIGTTAPWQVTSLDYVRTKNSFRLEKPIVNQRGQAHSEIPCMDITAWVDVRQGVNLDRISIEAAHLNITIEEGLINPDLDRSETPYLHIKNLAYFSSVSGDISSVYWASRDTVVRTVSGAITGQYALLDNLGLYSTSGDITVDVNPQEADKEHPKPAAFTAETTSGTIHVDFPLTGEIPARQYKTWVETTSANIFGRFIHGQTSKFHSTSGDLKISVLPYCYEGTASDLQTSSFSATTDVTILTPYNKSGVPWGQLHHSGRSTSGDLRLTYPLEWEGGIYLSTKTGEISVMGNVRKISEGIWPGNHYFEGKKGNGEGELGFDTISGDILVQVG